MDIEKTEKIVALLKGLKRYEWSKVRRAVEQAYDSASSRLELSDTESLRKLLQLELNGVIRQQHKESEK